MVANNFGPASMREDFPETSYFFLGLSTAGLLSGIWWIFYPVNYHFAAIINGIGIGYGLTFLPVLPDINFKKPLFLISATFLFVALLMKSVSPTSFYDCGLYYVQTIRWAQQFQVVPGLANLHIRFGNASLWHIFSAAYDLPSLWKGNFDSLGELMLFWFLSFHAWQFYSQQGFERYLSFGLMLAGGFFSFPLLGSPSPDLACGILGMHTLWQFRKFLRFWNPLQHNQLNTRGLTLFVQSFFLAGIKLSAFPFLLISFVICFLIIREGWIKQLSKLLIFGTAAFIALIYRSYILSGWLFFPLIKGSFSTDWQVEDKTVQDYLDGIKGFARHIPNAREIQSGVQYQSIAAQNFSEWFPVWASERNGMEWMLMIGGVLGWIFLFIYAGNKVRKRFTAQWPLIFFTWLSGMMLLFWFTNAPDPRFGLAALGSGFSYFIASIFIRIEKVFPLTGQFLYKPLLLIFSIAILVLFRDVRSLKSNVWIPSKYHRPIVKAYAIPGNMAIWTPAEEQASALLDGDMCWDSPLPCSVNRNKNLRRLGNSIGDGFRTESSAKKVGD